MESVALSLKLSQLSPKPHICCLPHTHCSPKQTEKTAFKPNSNIKYMKTNTFVVLFSPLSLVFYSTNTNIRCCGVVVITFALHAKGLQFDPGQHHFLSFFLKAGFLLRITRVCSAPIQTKDDALQTLKSYYYLLVSSFLQKQKLLSSPLFLYFQLV